MLVLPLGGPALAEVVAAGVDPAISVAGVLAIAPVCDLVSAAQEGLSDFHDAVPNLLWRFGHTAKEPAAPGAGLQHEAAAAACPVSLLRRLPPLAAAPRVLLVHGDRDTDVPPSLPLGFGEGPEKRLFTRRRRRTGAALAEPRLRRGCVGRARRPRDVAAPRPRVGPPRGEDSGRLREIAGDCVLLARESDHLEAKTRQTVLSPPSLPARPPRPPLSRPAPPRPSLHSTPAHPVRQPVGILVTDDGSPRVARYRRLQAAMRHFVAAGVAARCHGMPPPEEAEARGRSAPPVPLHPAPQHPNPRALAARALSTLARGGR